MLTIVAIVYYGSLPVSYDYKVGSIAVGDIYAPRTFTDTYETERRAVIARETADDIFVKSAAVSEENINRTKQFFELAEPGQERSHERACHESPAFIFGRRQQAFKWRFPRI